MPGTPTHSGPSLRWAQLALYLAADVAWVFAWSVVIGTWIGATEGAPPVDLAAIVAIAVVAAVLTRQVTRWPSLRRGPLALAALGIVIALAIGIGVAGDLPWAITWGLTWSRLAQTSLGWRVFAAMVLALVAWWRGIVAGRVSFTVDAVESGFRRAVTALVGLFLVAVVTGSSSALPTAPLIWLALVVLFAGLLGMPLARILQIGASPRGENDAPLRVSRQWLSLLLGTIVALLLVAIVLASTLTFERLDQLLAPIAQAVGKILEIIVYIIALPLGYLVEALVNLMRSLIHPTDHPPPPQAAGPSVLQRLKEQASSGNGPPELLVRVVTILIVVAVVALVLWLLARAVVKGEEASSDAAVEETRDFVGSWSAIKAAIVDWFARWRQRPSFRLASVLARGRPDADPDGRPLNPRELYRELQRLGARAGRRRANVETPNEYERALADVRSLSTGQAQVETLTRVYIQDRYAPAPPDAAMVEAARSALDRLRELEGGPGGPPA